MSDLPIVEQFCQSDSDVFDFLTAHPDTPPTEQLSLLIADITQRFTTGDSIPVDKYLSQCPDVAGDLTLKLNLIVRDFQVRLDSGQSPTIDDYIKRFPDLADALKNTLAAASVESEDKTTSTIDHSPSPQSSTVGFDMVPDHRKTFTPGDRFGDYEISGEIARGGMGVVFKARQISLNRQVALKMILSSRLSGEDVIQRFRTEAESAARLEHPGIVPIFEVGEIAGQHFYSMALVEDGSLADLRGETAVGSKRAAAITKFVAEAVQFAHSRNIVHRDLKPANVLLDKEGQPKVTDFGLAKNFEEDSGLTATGAILGTPGYMAPEQAAGKLNEIGPLADVYALGGLLYFLITGQPPFTGASPIETVQNVIHQEPVSPRSLNSETPLDLATICMKCLEKDPNRRYASAAELAKELENYLGNRPIAARPVGRAGRLWRWSLRNPALSCVTALAVLLFGTIPILTTIAYLRESGLRQIAVDSQKEAEEKGEETRKQLLNSHLDKAEARLEQKDPSGAMLWFAKAFELDAEHPDNHEIHRMRLGLTSMYCPPPTLTWELDESPMQMDISPDEKRFLLGYQSGRVEIYDLSAGHLIGEIRHGPYLAFAHFTPDGSQILTAGQLLARFWDAETLEPDGRDLKHDANVMTATLSQDGKYLVSSCRQRLIYVWSTQARKQTIPKLTDREYKPVSISADGKRVLSVSGTKATVIEIETGEIVGSTLRNTRQNEIVEGFLNHDGTRVCLVNEYFRVFDVQSGKQISQQFLAPGGGAVGSPNGRRIVDARWGHYYEDTSRDSFLIDFDSGKVTDNLATVRGPTRFSDDSTMIASYHPEEQLIQIVDLENQARKIIPGAEQFEIASSGRWILTVRDRVLSLFDLASGPDLTCLPYGASRNHVTAFDKSGQFFAVGSSTGRIHIWDVHEHRLVTSRPLHDDRVTGLAFSSDGNYLVSVGADQTLRVWNSSTGEAVCPPILLFLGKHLKNNYANLRVAFHPTHPELLRVKLPFPKSEERIINWQTQETLVEGIEPPAIFSPDGRWLISKGMRTSIESIDDVDHLDIGSPIGFLGKTNQLLARRDNQIWWHESIEHVGRVVIDAEDPPKSVNISQDGEIGLDISSTHLKVFSIPDGKLIFRRRMEEDVRTGAIETSARMFSLNGVKGVQLRDLKSGRALCPNIEIWSEGSAHFQPNNQLIVPSFREAVILDFGPADREFKAIDEWIEYSELLAGRRIDGNGAVVPLTAQEFKDRWRFLNERYPEAFTTSQGQQLAFDHDSLRRVTDVADTHRRKRVLEKLVKIDEGNSFYHKELGWSMFLFGDIEAGEEMTTRSTELDHNSPETWYQLGVVHASQQKWDDAVNAFFKSRHCRPWKDFHFVVDELTRTLLASGQEETAHDVIAETHQFFQFARGGYGIVEFDGTQRISPNITLRAQDYNSLAWSAALTGGNRETMQTIYHLAAQELGDDHSSAYKNTLGAIAWRAAEPAEAQTFLEESMNIKGQGDFYDWIFLAMVHKDIDNSPAAQQWLKKALLDNGQCELWVPNYEGSKRLLSWTEFAERKILLEEARERIPLDDTPYENPTPTGPGKLIVELPLQRVELVVDEGAIRSQSWKEDARRLEFELPAGKHSLRVRSDGREDHLVEVKIESQMETRLKLPRLIDLPPQREESRVTLGKWKPGLGVDELPGLATHPEAFDGIHRWQLVPRSPSGLIQSIACSPDGKRVALSSQEPLVRVFDAETNELKHVFPGCATCINYNQNLRFHPTQQLLGAADGGLIRIWDLQTGKLAGTPVVGGSVWDFCWNPQGDRLAAVTADGSVRVTSLETEIVEKTIKGPPCQYVSVDWSPDGRWIAAGATNGTLMIWNTTGTDQEPVILREKGARVTAIRFSQDSRMLAYREHHRAGVFTVESRSKVADVAASGGGFIVWNPSIPDEVLIGGNQICRWRLGQEEAEKLELLRAPSLAVSPDGAKLYGGTTTQGVLVWNLENAEMLEPLTDKKPSINSIAWGNDDEQIAVGLSDGRVLLFDPMTGRSRVCQQQFAAPIKSLAWQPGENRLAVADASEIVILNPSEDAEPQTLDVPSAYDLAWSRDGTRLATAGMDRKLRLWAAQTGEVEEEFDYFTSEIAWSPIDDILAAARSGKDEIQLFWPGNPNERKTFVGFGRAQSDLCWSMNGKYVYSIDYSYLHRSSLEDGQQEQLSPIGGWALDTTTSLEGKTINKVATFSRYHRLEVSSTLDNQPLVLSSGPDRASQIRWSHSGRQLAVAGEDGSLTLWPNPTLPYRWRVQFLPDGSIVRLNAAGELLDDASPTSSELRFLTESTDGTFQLHTATRFRELVDADSITRKGD